jgi:hypothetical protein
MSAIIPNGEFDFSKIKLGNPSGIQGGAYFSKITVNDESLYIQTPKCGTKSGITTSDKKNCVDFMFNVEQTTFSDWIEQFERKIKELIYQRRDAWFTSDMTMEDIEYFFTPMSRVYKTKNYLVRAFEQKNKMFKTEKKYSFGLFGENGEEIGGDELMAENAQCISILDIQGLKFTSNSFRIEVAILQIMVIKEKKLREQCIIKKLDVDSPKIKIETSASAEIEEKEVAIAPTPKTKIPVETTPKMDEDTSIQEVVIDDIIEETPGDIQEINIVPSALTDAPISLKQPTQVYYEIYREARKKAKIAKNLAIKAYLEAKRIKNTYLLEDFDSDVSSSSEVEDEDNIFEAI